MKYIVLVTYLILQLVPCNIWAEENINPVEFIPSDVSFLLYLNSFDRTFSEFQSSYFWKKYKQTKKGKHLQETLESVDASFIMIGLTLNDLLEIFSKQAFLGVWLEKEQYVKDYIYLIEKEDNKKIIKNVIERLEYFAVANKIDLRKYDYYSFKIYNFANKIFLASSKDYVLISNNNLTINKVCDRIEKKITDKHQIVDFNKYFKNKNLVFYLNKTNKQTKKLANIHYSFRFNKSPELEILYLNKTQEYTNCTKLDKDFFKMIPAGVNCIYFAEQDIRPLLYPFFNIIGTNIYALDNSYFSTYLSKINFNNCRGITVFKLNSKSTNILKIWIERTTNEYKHILNKNNFKNSYRKVEIFIYNNEYYARIKNKILSSKHLSFLKKAIEAYKKNKGFYHTKHYRHLKKKKNICMWMNLRRYLTSKSLKYKKERWLYYNAYIKTFDKAIIESKQKNDYIYYKLSFY